MTEVMSSTVDEQAVCMNESPKDSYVYRFTIALEPTKKRKQKR